MPHTSSGRKRVLACLLICVACYVSLCQIVFGLAQRDATASSGSPQIPIVLVPGLAGSVLDAKLDRSSTAAWYCSRKADWRVVYLSFREVLSPLCLCDELVVSYDEDNDRYHNQKGVEIRPHDFGGLDGVSALDPAYSYATATYAPLIKALEKAGYENGVNLWGAPYDWRLAADGLEDVGFGDELKTLLETAYDTAGGTKVVIIAHSMGNLVVSHFLKSWGDDWTRKHVHTFIATSGLDMLARVYPKLRDMREKQLEDGVLPIPLLCVYGDGIDTDVSYTYDVDNLTSSSLPEPKAIRSDAGDGTVPRRSLELCTDMGNSKMTDTIVVHKASHLGVLSSDALINAIHKTVRLSLNPSALTEEASSAARHACAAPTSWTRRVQQAIMARSLSALFEFGTPTQCMRGR